MSTEINDNFSKDVWINKRTGEEIEAAKILKRVARDDFEITYIAYLMDIFDKLGGRKYSVLKYIIKNKSLDNTLIITNRELANAVGVSIYTVVEALKMLRDAGLINTRTGAIILNPKIAMKGSKAKELYLIQKFEAFDKPIEE